MKRIVLLALALAFVLGFSGQALAQGKTFRLALAGDPEALDPQHLLSGPMVQYSNIVFDPLIRWTKDMKFEGRLAEKWERIDPLTMRFHLRKGVKFHSGNLMTARDVKWTIDRAKTSKDFKALFDVFESPVIVDDHTVDIKTTKPYPLVENMATYMFVMDSKFYTGTDEKGQPKDAINKTGYSFANEHESGTGRFTVVSREPGVKWVLKRFPDYWEKNAKGNVDQIILTPIKENATRVSALLSGDVDYISPVPPQDYERVRSNKDLKLITMASSRIITFSINQNKTPALANLKVRQAILAAIDNAGIVQKIMNKTTSPSQQASPKGFLGYVEGLKPRYNMEKARALMKEAGFEKGFNLSMISTNDRYTNDEKIAQAVVGMLSKINIKVDLKTMPKSQYWDVFDSCAADLQIVGWHPDTEDSGNYGEYLFMCKNKEKGYGQYNAGYCNPKVDELLLAAQAETDKTKRAKILQEVETITYNDAAFIPLHYEPLAWGTKKNLNTEEVVNVMDFPHFEKLVIK
ncbi:MAG: ABC transporter substrate-binding protein [Desulfobacteraceae bacterium]|nr:ABC transporter substrate-binding protein [Desulfobacteraceae bacterium]